MPQRNSLVRLGQGSPGPLLMAKSGETANAGATQHRPQQRSQSGLRPGSRDIEGSLDSWTLMADKEQVARLLNSASDWNRWRARNPGKRADLRGADLRHTD